MLPAGYALSIDDKKNVQVWDHLQTIQTLVDPLQPGLHILILNAYLS